MTKDLILDIAATCNVPTGDAVLDGMFDGYNTNSPREDVPVYYRFLYQLSKRCPGLSMIELGSYKGGASLHFLRGGGAFSTGIDLHPRHDPAMFDGRFHSMTMDSLDSEPFVEGECNILLIDTDHTYDRTAKEFNLWRHAMLPGGLILFDDICAPEFGCTKFFEELEGDKLTLPELHIGYGFGILFA